MFRSSLLGSRPFPPVEGSQSRRARSATARGSCSSDVAISESTNHADGCLTYEHDGDVRHAEVRLVDFLEHEATAATIDEVVILRYTPTKSSTSLPEGALQSALLGMAGTICNALHGVPRFQGCTETRVEALRARRYAPVLASSSASSHRPRASLRGKVARNRPTARSLHSLPTRLSRKGYPLEVGDHANENFLHDAGTDVFWI